MIRLLKYWNANNGYIYESYSLEQKIANMNFFACNNLEDYLFSAINSFSTWDLPEYKRQKVDRAKQIVTSAHKYKKMGLSIASETEIKKLLPEL